MRLYFPVDLTGNLIMIKNLVLGGIWTGDLPIFNWLIDWYFRLFHIEDIPPLLKSYKLTAIDNEVKLIIIMPNSI